MDCQRAPFLAFGDLEPCKFASSILFQQIFQLVTACT